MSDDVKLLDPTTITKLAAFFDVPKERLYSIVEGDDESSD